MMKRILSVLAATLLLSACGLCAAQEPAPDQKPDDPKPNAPANPPKRGKGHGERPDFKGERHGQERPEFKGERPDFKGERPDFKGERPDFDRWDGEYRNGDRPDFARDGRGPKADCPRGDYQRPDCPRPEGCPFAKDCPKQDCPKQDCPRYDGERPDFNRHDGDRPNGPRFDGPKFDGPKFDGPFPPKCPRMPFMDENGDISIEKAIHFMKKLDKDDNGTITKEEIRESFEQFKANMKPNMKPNEMREPGDRHGWDNDREARPGWDDADCPMMKPNGRHGHHHDRDFDREQSDREHFDRGPVSGEMKGRPDRGPDFVPTPKKGHAPMPEEDGAGE